jgi:ribosomal protein S6--L-glutamate ligase
MARRTAPRFLLLRYEGVQQHARNRFVEAATARGWQVEEAMPHRLLTVVHPGAVRVQIGERTLSPDYVAFLSVGSHPKVVIPALRLLAEGGATVLNEIGAAFRARNRFNAMLRLAQAGLPVPTTVMAAGNEEALEAGLVTGYPLVAKRVEGSMAEGVGLIDSPEFLEEGLAEVRRTPAEPVLLQSFISESSGADIRTVVIGDRVLGAMERRSIWPSEFRSALRLGGLASSVELSFDERELVLAAARALELDYLSVDLLRQADGSALLVGVNAWPTFEDFEKITGADVAGLALDYLAHKGGPDRPRPSPRPSPKARPV